MTTFGSRLSTCYRVLQKERLLTYGVDSPGQSRGISPLQGASPSEGFKGAWRGLQGFKGAWRRLEAFRRWRELRGGLKGGLKGASRGLEGGFTFGGRLQGGLKGASRGLQGGLKGACSLPKVKGASTGLEGGLKGASRGLEGGLTFKGA